MQSVGFSWLIDPCFSPLEAGPPESLPVEAWPVPAPAARTLRLGFNSAASYQALRVDTAKLFFARERATPLPGATSPSSCWPSSCLNNC